MFVCSIYFSQVSLHNMQGYMSTEIRMVTEKYVCPDWNPEVHVGDLALLIIDKPFNQFKYIKTPFMIGNDRKNVPEMLYFRGFAKIHHKSLADFPLYSNGETGIPDAMAKRELFVEFSPDVCPLVENRSVTYFFFYIIIF